MNDQQSPVRRVRLLTLGRIDLRRGETSVQSVLTQPRRLALLLYLALARPDGFRRRDELLAMFWPDSDEPRARNALNQAIHRLRASLGGGVLPGRARDEIGVDTALVACDASELDALLDSGRLAEGVALYAGPLLPGFHVDGAPEFAEWLDRERTRIVDRVFSAHISLADGAESGDEPEMAIRHLRDALDLRPASEPVIERLVDLHARTGNRAGAIADHERYAARVRSELGIELSASLGDRIEMLAASPSAAGRSTDSRMRQVAQTPPPEKTIAVASSPVTGLDSHEGRRSVSRRRRVSRITAIVALAVVALFAAIRLAGRPSGTLSPADTGDRIVILPFAVFADDLTEFGPGMVPILAANLAQAGALDVVGERAALNFMDDANAGTDAASVAADAARAFGATRIVTGSIATADGQVRLMAELRDASGEVTDRAVVDGLRGELIPLVDSLTLALVRRIWSSREPVPHMRLAAVTSASLAALGAFVHGEGSRRAAKYDSAIVAYESALRHDSTFALAQLRLLEARGWASPGFIGPAFATDVRRLQAHLDRLPPTERSIAHAWILWYNGDLAVIDSAAATVRYRADDPMAWMILGEAYIHNRPFVTPSLDSLRMIFDRVLTLDPTAPDAFYHALQIELEADDRSRYDALLDRFAALGQPDRVDFHTALRDLRWGPPDSVPAVFARTIAASDRPASDPLFGLDVYDLLAAATNNIAEASVATPDVLVDALLRAEREAEYPDRRLFLRYLRNRTLVELGRGHQSHELPESFEGNAPVTAFAATLGLVDPESAVLPTDLLAVPIVGAFSEALAAVRRRDAPAVRAQARRLESLDETSDTAGLGYARLPATAARSFAPVLDALALMLDDETGAGALAFDDAIHAIPFRGRLRSYLFVPTWEAARLLAASPELRERGLRMLHNFTQGLGFCCTAGLARIEMASALEQAGDYAAARELYAEVLALWQDAGPPVAAIRNTVETRLRRLPE